MIRLREEQLIIEKFAKGCAEIHCLPQERKKNNRKKSTIRARVEHGERFYNEYDERHLCKNDRISPRNILNNNDEPYL